MDLSAYSLEDLVITAIQSEVASKKVYETLAGRVKNAFLKDRLVFLAGEEQRHAEFVTGIYRTNYPGKKIVMPGKSPVPLPEVNIKDEMVPISEVLESAMEAEMAARDFYDVLADRFDKGSNNWKVLKYFARMELGHYEMLKTEQDNVKRFEEFDETWEMMHAGP